MDQKTPYWDAVATRLAVGSASGPVYDASIELLLGVQAAAASGTVVLGVAPRAGQITDARVAAITPLTGNATYTVDIHKNGVSILSAVLALSTGTAARASVVGALATTSVAAGDFFEAVVTNTPGTGAAPANIVFQVQLLLN